MRGHIFSALLLAGLLMLSQSGNANAQSSEQAAEPAVDLYYQHTGNALWDSYAQALLDAFPRIDEHAPFLPESQGTLRSFFSLPDELLASWEPRFGDDPRYWQLCWWNSIGRENEDRASSLVFLEESQRRGQRDPFTDMHLAALELQELNNAWTASEQGEASAEQLSLFPQGMSGQALVNWCLEAELRQLTELQQRYPQESFFAYELALEQMEFGEWEAGLQSMAAGNRTEHNRLPLPFPASFLIEKMEQTGQDYDPLLPDFPEQLEQAVGSPLAAGIALERLYTVELPHYISYKEYAKVQLTRFAMGAEPAELEVWQSFLLRFGAMQGSPAVHWIHGSVLQSIFSHYFLVESPASLPIEEREKLWQAQQDLRPIAVMVRHGLNNSAADLSSAQMLRLYNMVGADTREQMERVALAIGVLPEELNVQGAAGKYLRIFEQHILEYGRYGALARAAYASAAAPGEDRQY